VFRRGHGLFRRAYYRGPNGDIFFYDEEVPPNDAAVASIANVDQLPECPEDADDCQGFDDNNAAPQTVAVISGRTRAFEFLSTLRGVGFREDGIVSETDDEGQETIEPYSGWRMTVEKRKIGFVDFGDERLMLHSDKGGFFNLMVGSYDQNKASWNQIVSALRTMGVRVTPPGPDERNITSIPLFRP
jgi:hypothetical protein